MKWTMRDGTKIEISAMTDGHLANTIAFLGRRIIDLDDETMAGFGYSGGEMAQYYAEQSANEAIAESIKCRAILAVMEQEQQRRQGK